MLFSHGVIRVHALECYFLGNGVTMSSERMDVDAVSVYVFLRVRSARIRRINALARKRRRALAQRRMMLARKQAQQHVFFVVMMSMIACNLSSPARS